MRVQFIAEYKKDEANYYATSHFHFRLAGTVCHGLVKALSTFELMLRS